MSSREQREAISAAQKRIEEHLKQWDHRITDASVNIDDGLAKSNAAERTHGTLPTWTHRASKPAMDLLLQFHERSERRGAVNAMMRLIERHGMQGLQRVGIFSNGSTLYKREIAIAARAHNIPFYSVQPSSGDGAEKTEAPFLDIGRLEIGSKPSLLPESNASTHAVPFPPFDDIDAIHGQGTFALELEREMTLPRHQDPGSNPFQVDYTNRPDIVISDLDSGITLSGICMAFAGTGTRVFGAAPSSGFWDHAWKDYPVGTPTQECQHQYWSETKHPMSGIPWSTFTAPGQLSGIFEASDEQIHAASAVAREHYKLPLAFDEAVPLAVALYNEDLRWLVDKDARENRRGRKVVIGIILRSRKVRN